MSTNIAAHPVTHKYAWRHGQPAPGGRVDTAPALGTVSLHKQSGQLQEHMPTQMCTNRSQPQGTEAQRKHQTHRGPRSCAIPHHLPPHHSHESMCSHFPPPCVPQPPMCAFRPRFLPYALGLLRPVPLPSELGWALPSAEISWRNRAIFCHRQEVRMRE